MIQMKEEFCQSRQWVGKVPDAFSEILDYVITMKFDQDPDPIFLLNTLVQMEFSFLEFEFSEAHIQNLEEVLSAIELTKTKSDCL